jgi:hypothetical protein
MGKGSNQLSGRALRPGWQQKSEQDSNHEAESVKVETANTQRETVRSSERERKEEEGKKESMG